jgi:hypothetical protein
MRKLQLLAILTTAIAVHVDWHLGRPAHISHSLAWEDHWIFGLILGSSIACLLAWRGAAQPLARFLTVALAGFFIGQIVEPLSEVLIYDESLAFVYPAIRWILFLEFAAAFLVSGVACLALQRLTNRGASGLRPA